MQRSCESRTFIHIYGDLSYARETSPLLTLLYYTHFLCFYILLSPLLSFLAWRSATITCSTPTNFIFNSLVLTMMPATVCTPAHKYPHLVFSNSVYLHDIYTCTIKHEALLCVCSYQQYEGK